MRDNVTGTGANPVYMAVRRSPCENRNVVYKLIGRHFSLIVPLPLQFFIRDIGRSPIIPSEPGGPDRSVDSKSKSSTSLPWLLRSSRTAHSFLTMISLPLASVLLRGLFLSPRLMPYRSLLVGCDARPLPYIWEPKMAGRAWTRSARMAGMLAHNIPTHSSIMDQYAAST